MNISEAPFARDFDHDPVFHEKDVPFFEKLAGKLGYLSEADRQTVISTARFTVWAFRAYGIEDRNDGTPASSHLLETASILSDYRMPAKALQYALLHDVPEDIKQMDVGFIGSFIGKYFGEDIASGVNRIGVVKTDEISPEMQAKSDFRRDSELRARLYEAVIEDPLAAITRFAERLHNLRTIQGRLSRGEKGRISAERTARETITVYAPLAQDLGMYNMAFEMYSRSLAVLFPADMEIIEETGKPEDFVFNIRDERFQAYKIEMQNRVMEAFLTINKAVPPQEIEVFPPNMKIFSNLMLKHKDIRNIEIGSLPMDIDVVADPDTATYYSYHLAKSRQFQTREGGGDDFFRQIEKNSVRQLTWKANNLSINENRIPLPVNFNFLTSDQKKYKQASLADLFSVEEEKDAVSVSSAEEKYDRISQTLGKIKSRLGRDDEERDVTYTRGIERNVVFPEVTVNGVELGEIPVITGMTVYETILHITDNPEIKDMIAVGLLDADFFLKLKEVRIADESRDLESQVVRQIAKKTHIEILTGEEIFIKPGWIESIKNPAGNVLDRVSEVLAELSLRDESIRIEARDIGIRYVKNQFRHLSGDRKRTSIIHGFDRDLMDRFGSNPEEFFIALGIRQISRETADSVIKKTVEWFNSLPVMQVSVFEGQNRPGIKKICDESISRADMNIVISIAGEFERLMRMGRTVTGEMIYWLEPGIHGKPITPVDLERVSRRIKNKIKKESRTDIEPHIRIFMNNEERLRKNPES